jgi:hypothetical protein
VPAGADEEIANAFAQVLIRATEALVIMDEKGAYLIAQGLAGAEEYLRNPRDFEAY